MNPPYRPTARQELVLHAALLTGEEGRAAWRQVRASMAFEPLDAASEALLPLVYRNLARLDTGAEEMEGLKERYVLTWSENLRLYHAVVPLLRAFEHSGIDAVVLKGLALTARFYRDLGVRPMADVDVLVSAENVGRAGEVAVGLGWHPRHRLTPAFLRVKHAGPLDHAMGVACDLHWRVFEEAGGGPSMTSAPPPSW